MQTALLICADTSISNTIIQAMQSKYDIWHVARQRDAIAWLNIHQPTTVIIDMDFLELDTNTLLNIIRDHESSHHVYVVGLSNNPEQLSPFLSENLDLVTTPASLTHI